MGYIFQMFNLIPYLNVLENILLPCQINRERRRRVAGASLESEARALAERLGIGHLVNESVIDLSVGQQQRVAAARALLGAPELIIADEPTSALDEDQRENFLDLLFSHCGAIGSTLLFVSHDRRMMPLFDRALSLPEINRV
jgi:putative ABC transport system ATP-binding protein